MKTLPRQVSGRFLERVGTVLRDRRITTAADLEKKTGIPTPVGAQILAGRVEPLLLTRWARSLRPALGMSMKDMVDGVLDTLDPRSQSVGGFRVIYERLIMVGWGPSELAAALHLPPNQVRRALRRRVLGQQPLIEAMSSWLGITPEALRAIDHDERWRARAPSKELNGTFLWELIWSAVLKSKLSVTDWAKHNGFSRPIIHGLASGKAVHMHSPATLERLAKAISVPHSHARQAYRQQLLRPIDEVQGGAYQVAQQIEILRKKQSKSGDFRDGRVPLAIMAAKMDIHPSTLSAFLTNHTIHEISAESRERIRRYLGISCSEWITLVTTPKAQNLDAVPLRSQSKSLLTGDDEVHLLRLWRKATDQQRAQAREILASPPAKEKSSSRTHPSTVSREARTT